MLGLPKNHKQDIGHQLKLEHAEKGFNFLSSEAHAYIVKRSRSWRVLVNRERVLSNLISSQALCFNLFTDLKMGLLRKDPAASQVIKSMFPQLPIDKVVSVDLEKLPRIQGFKKVATAFDAVIVFKDTQGLESILGIEVKYLEGLDERRVGGGQRWYSLAKSFDIFNTKGLAAYPPKLGFNQIARNFLLTLAYAKHPQRRVYSFTLGLAEDEETQVKVKQFKQMLKKPFSEMIQFVSLEEVVGNGLSAEGNPRNSDSLYRDVLQKIQTRYFC
jgi:hypothetical protein